MANIRFLKFGPQCKHKRTDLRLLYKVKINSGRKMYIPNTYQCMCGCIVKRENVNIKNLKEL